MQFARLFTTNKYRHFDINKPPAAGASSAVSGTSRGQNQ